MKDFGKNNKKLTLAKNIHVYWAFRLQMLPSSAKIKMQMSYGFLLDIPRNFFFFLPESLPITLFLKTSFSITTTILNKLPSTCALELKRKLPKALRKHFTCSVPVQLLTVYGCFTVLYLPYMKLIAFTKWVDKSPQKSKVVCMTVLQRWPLQQICLPRWY